MLNPSQRKKVAEACTGHQWFVVGSDICRTNEVNTELATQDKYYWIPEKCLVQKDALVSKIAGLIEAMPYDFGNVEKGRIMRRFITALATNSTHDLESLAYELLEAE